MISTKHTNKIISIDRIKKSEVVVDYNAKKGFIDLTDQFQLYLHLYENYLSGTEKY